MSEHQPKPSQVASAFGHDGKAVNGVHAANTRKRANEGSGAAFAMRSPPAKCVRSKRVCMNMNGSNTNSRNSNQPRANDKRLNSDKAQRVNNNTISVQDVFGAQQELKQRMVTKPDYSPTFPTLATGEQPLPTASLSSTSAAPPASSSVQYQAIEHAIYGDARVTAGASYELTCHLLKELRGMKQTQHEMQATQNELMMHVQQLTAKTRNEDIFRKNRRAFRMAISATTQKMPLAPILKMTSGNGNPLPGMSNRYAYGGEPASVGTLVPQEHFPRRVYDTKHWNHKQISWLVTWLNEDFGIVAGDSNEIKRKKFIAYICGNRMEHEDDESDGDDDNGGGSGGTNSTSGNGSDRRKSTGSHKDHTKKAGR